MSGRDLDDYMIRRIGPLPESYKLFGDAWRNASKLTLEEQYTAVKRVACEQIMLDDESVSVVEFDRGEAVVVQAYVPSIWEGNLAGVGRAWTVKGFTPFWKIQTYSGDSGADYRMMRAMENKVFRMTGWRRP